MIRSVLVLVLAAAALLALLAASPAAAQSRGATAVTLTPAALKELRTQGVSVAARRPATLRRRVVSLPVERGTLDRRVALEHDGAIVLRRGRRRLVLDAPRFDLRSLRATVRGRSVTVMRALGGRRAVDASAGTATLSPARLTLTRAGTALLRRTLRIRRAPRLLGTVATGAALRGGEPARPGDPTPGPSGSGGGSGAGGGSSPGSGPAPSNEPFGDEPPVKARPATAGGLSAVRIVWHPRESFIRYLSSSALAESRGTIVREGASEAPATMGADGRQVPLEYDFGYAPLAERSWTDAASAATALYFRGSLNFRHVEHGIDLEAKDPEIELDGAASRAIFRFEGRDGTRTEGEPRSVLLDLDPEKVTPTVSGQTTTYDRIPATVAQGAEKTVFGGFYEPGSEFGAVTVSYTR